VQVEETQIYVAFWPLLQGGLVINEVFLAKPQVSVVIAESGVANYADLMEPSEDGAEGSGTVLVHDVILADGVVVYTDRKSKTELRLEGIQYALGMTADAFNGDLSVGQVGWQEGDVAEALDTGILQLRHRLQKEGVAWQVHALELDWAGLTLTVSGRIEMVGDVTRLDLKIAEPGLDLETTQLREVAKLPVDVTGRASVSLEIVGDMNLTTTPAQYPNLQGQVSLSKVVIAGEGLPQETRIDTASLALTDGTLLALVKGNALDGQFELQGHGAPVWPPETGKRLSVTVNAKTDRVRLLAQEEQNETNTEAQPNVIPYLRMLDAQVDVALGQVVSPDLDATNVSAKATLRNGLLTLNQFGGQVFGGTVRLSGELNAQPNRSDFPVRVDIRTDALQLKSMLGDTEGLDVDAKVAMDILAKGVLDDQMVPQLQSGKYSVLGTVSLSDGQLKTPELLTAVDALELALRFAQNDVVEITKLEALAGENDLHITGRVTDILKLALEPNSQVRPYAEARVRSRVLNMDTLFSPELPTEGDQTSGMLVAIRQADGRVDMRIEKLVSDSTEFTNFQAVAIAKNGVLQVDSIRANTMGGVLTAQAEIKGQTNSIPVKATASLSRVQANQLLQDYMGWPIPMLGQLGLAVKLDGKMDSTLVLIEKTITADGEARLDEGKVVNWPWLQTTSGFVPHLQFLNFSDLPLKALIAPFKIEDGRVFLNQMGFNSGDVGFQMVGSVGIDGTLDMAVDADVPASLINVSGLGLDRIAGLNLKSDTRIPLRIQVGGTSDKPKIEAKLQPEAKKALEAKSDEVKEKAKEKAKGLLKSLF